MLKLERSKDRKVANKATPNGKQAKIANTFGLPAGKEYSCPYQTSICAKICYAGKLEKLFPSVKRMLLRNWAIVKDASINELVELLDTMLVSFEIECEKNNAEKLFRIHWDGDFFSDSYAIAWRRVIEKHPNVEFWCYTRVPTAVGILHNLPNLVLYFSTDKDNAAIGARLNKLYKVKLAALEISFNAAQVMLKELVNETGTKCPENNRKIPLITNRGGACVSCGLCVHGRNHVLFSISKK